MRGSNFRDELVDKIAERDGSKVSEGKGFLLLRDQCNESRVQKG